MLRRLLIVLGVAAVSACATTAASAAASGGGHRFETEQNRYLLGQAPDWLDARNEIVTASEVDWPVQSRLLELMDNRDGTLSIFGTLIDQGRPIAPPRAGTPAARFGRSALAAIGRSFSFNDPQSETNGGPGAPPDRNVELLLADPRRR